MMIVTKSKAPPQALLVIPTIRGTTIRAVPTTRVPILELLLGAVVLVVDRNAHVTPHPNPGILVLAELLLLLGATTGHLLMVDALTKSVFHNVTEPSTTRQL